MSITHSTYIKPQPPLHCIQEHRCKKSKHQSNRLAHPMPSLLHSVDLKKNITLLKLNQFSVWIYHSILQPETKNLIYKHLLVHWVQVKLKLIGETTLTKAPTTAWIQSASFSPKLNNINPVGWSTCAIGSYTCGAFTGNSSNLLAGMGHHEWSHGHQKMKYTLSKYPTGGEQNCFSAL